MQQQLGSQQLEAQPQLGSQQLEAHPQLGSQQLEAQPQLGSQHESQQLFLQQRFLANMHFSFEKKLHFFLQQGWQQLDSQQQLGSQQLGAQQLGSQQLGAQPQLGSQQEEWPQRLNRPASAPELARARNAKANRAGTQMRLTMRRTP